MDAVNYLCMQLTITTSKSNQRLSVTQITVKLLVKLLDTTFI